MIGREDIAEVTQNAVDKEEFADILSNHFDEMAEPCCVSLGIDMAGRKISDIVQVLRNSGIDARGYYEDGVENPACFVVDGTGIKTPFMAPKDALKATLDIYNSLNAEGIKIQGYALPVFFENLVSAKAAASSSVIDVAENAGTDKDKTEIFIKGMLAKVKDLPEVDIAQVDERNADKKMLFRGGLLGDEPYAVVSSRRGREVGYATPYLENAANYADGTFSSGVCFQKVDGKAYGFVYAFEAAKTQKYFTAYGIERRGKVGGIHFKKGEDNPYYETPLFKHRNPLTGIYLKYGDKLVQIGDKNGYFSEAWQKFAELHNANSSFEKNDRMVMRANRQKEEAKIYPYQKIAKESGVRSFSGLSEREQLEGFVYSSNVQASTEQGGFVIRNAQMLSVDLPEVFNKAAFAGDVKLKNCSFSTAGGVLDLSRCDGDVSLENCDLSVFDEIVLPKQCKTLYLGGVKFPHNMKTLDLSGVLCQKVLVFGNQDMSGVEALVMPEHQPESVKFWGHNQMPRKVYGMGTAVDEKCLESMDFRGTELLSVCDEASRLLFQGRAKNVIAASGNDRNSQELMLARSMVGVASKEAKTPKKEVISLAVLQNKNVQSR